MANNILLKAPLFVAASIFLNFASAFLFGESETTDGCYYLEVQRCLSNAFQAMQTESKRAGFTMLGIVDMRNGTIPGERETHGIIEVEKRSTRRRTSFQTKNRHMCAANRAYLTCFQTPGCSDEAIARVAAGVFYGIHGRVFPMQVFLSHRGYAIQLCSHACSRESRAFCQRSMSQQEQNEEHGVYLELVGLSRQIQIAIDRRGAWDICTRFRDALNTVVRFRARYCGEAAKCACTDSRIQGAVTFCRAGCEAILDQMSTLGSYDGGDAFESSHQSRGPFVAIYGLVLACFLAFALQRI